MRAHPLRSLLATTSLVALVACAPATDGPSDGGSDAGEGLADDEGYLEASITGSPGGHATLSVDTFPEAFAKWRDTPTGERLSVHANADPGVTDRYGVGSQSLRIYFIFDGEREYGFGPPDGAGGAYAELDDTHEFFAHYGNELGAGTITITTRTDTRLAGTFTMTGESDDDRTVILDGEFDLPLVPDGG